MSKTYGPYETYTEVETHRGVYGVSPGQILEVFDEGSEVGTVFHEAVSNDNGGVSFLPRGFSADDESEEE